MDPVVTCGHCGFVNPATFRFCGQCGHRLAGLADASQAGYRENEGESGRALIARQAERRRLTVVFCDLVDSTALSQKLDPEELRRVVRLFRQACAEAVRQFDGYVARFLGDGIVVYFGYPRAHEDDPERAVRSALAAVAGIRKLGAEVGKELAVEIAVRIGIATGLVVAGDLVGETVSEEMAVFGETPNRAARLQNLAAPNTVVIGTITRRLLGELFEYEELGWHELKGFARPEFVWRVVRPRSAATRFEATRADRVTALVGREQEQRRLSELWACAKEGHGQVVLISGQAGIGKSRLVDAFRAEIAREPHIRVRYQFSSFLAESPLHPVIDHLGRAARWRADDTIEVKRGKLEALLALGIERAAEVAPLFFALTGVQSEQELASIRLSPNEQKEKILSALIGQMQGLARRKPLFVVFEDVHWIDPSSLDLLRRVIEHAERTPVLVVVTYRPDAEPVWPQRPYVTPLRLERLGRREAARMIDHLAGELALPHEIMNEILLKTDGVPLFVAELTRSVLEMEEVRRTDDGYVLTRPLDGLDIPATLHDSLMARLDHLGPVKSLAQLASVLGRDFSYDVLRVVHPEDDEAGLQEDLERLVQVELLHRKGRPPAAAYEFRHALIQDAAYGSLLRADRQKLHGYVADQIEDRHPQYCRAEPAELARHHEGAGNVEKAARYRLEAGKLALEKSAYVEAASHLRHGLKLTEAVRESPERSRLAFALELNLGTALTAVMGYSNPVVEETYLRAERLSIEAADEVERWRVGLGLWRLYASRAELGKGRERANTLLTAAERIGEPTMILTGHLAVGIMTLCTGEADVADAHFDRVQGLYRPEVHAPLAIRLGQDPGITGILWRALGMWLRGYPVRARAEADEGLALARRLGHPFTLAYTLYMAALLDDLLGDGAAMSGKAREAVSLCDEYNLGFQKGRAAFVAAAARARRAQSDYVVAAMRRGMDAYKETGARLHLPYFLCRIAEAEARLGRTRDGLAALELAVETAEVTGERWCLAEFLRLKGDLLAIETPQRRDHARESYQRAMAVATAQQMPAWQLRAAMSLVRLDAGSGGEASRQSLETVLRSFSEGQETPDLKEASALLDGRR